MENWEKYGFLSKEAYEFPTIVNVNLLSGSCVCSCVHCPVGRIPQGKRATSFRCGSMSADVFKRTADEIAKHPGCVLRLHSVGEPLLYGFLSEAVRYTKKHNVKTWLFTSATIRSPELYRTLCENVDIIEISVNSTDRQNYIDTKGTDLFELVSENIDLMREIVLSEKLGTRLI